MNYDKLRWGEARILAYHRKGSHDSGSDLPLPPNFSGIQRRLLNYGLLSLGRDEWGGCIIANDRGNRCLEVYENTRKNCWIIKKEGINN